MSQENVEFVRRAAEAPLDSMDPADTPGTRATIDRCEIKAELGPG